MASVVKESGGRRLIQLSPGEDPRRPKVHLGRVTAKQAATACGHVEQLAAARRTGHAIPPATVDWLEGLPEAMRTRLEKLRLTEPRQRRACPTLGEWVTAYIKSRTDVKPRTAIIYRQTERNLLTFFGADKPLDAITPGDADAFGVHLRTVENLAENTARRRMGVAKQFLRAAVRKRHIGENAFDGQSTTVRENPKRFHFVGAEEAEAVLDACPDAQWRLAFALCRYGGLRCPSEVVRLTWGDINWERARFTVHASKTEHHADQGVRVVPIFPELLPHLRDAFEEAEPGAVHCCPQFANAGPMYRKTMAAIVKRAGLVPWPKLFQNLRSSRETELTESFPVHVVCKWIGNSPKVAAAHYLQTTEAHFERATTGAVHNAVHNPVHDAVHNPVQRPAATARTEAQNPGEGPGIHGKCGEMRPIAANCGLQNDLSLRPTGLEPVTSSSGG